MGKGEHVFAETFGSSGARVARRIGNRMSGDGGEWSGWKGALILGAAIVAAWFITTDKKTRSNVLFGSVPVKRRVFLSFDADDRKQVDGLRLLNANPDFEIEFYDESVRTPYDSTNADYIRTKIREKITRSGLTVCLIGQNTHKSSWVEWELEETGRQAKPVIAMALKGIERAVLPPFIKVRVNARPPTMAFWPWDYQNLARLIGVA